MASPSDVRGFVVSRDGFPWLWKAQRAFLSAEYLREKEHLDCAANRYYYAFANVAFHFVGQHNKDLSEKSHGDLVREYARNIDQDASEALGRVQTARWRADYSPIPVNPKKIAQLVLPMTRLMVRAFEKAKLPKEG